MQPSAAGTREKPPYDVLVVGGGASGTALLYVLSRYSDIPRLALVEKYAELGTVNSNAKNNSQTLHIGEIETNYSMKKAAEVYGAATMIQKYADALTPERRKHILRETQKMVLAVGASEVDVLEKRYEPLKAIYPFLQKLDAGGIALVEPEIMRGRDPREAVLALFNPAGYAVNYGNLARSFVHDARAKDARADVLLETSVISVEKEMGLYRVRTDKGDLFARVVVFDTDAYSLGFAKSLGYGKEFSLIPIAGSFYFTGKKLNGKVYRVQDPKMPFAAVHGDSELTKEGATRWGPTARFYPVLEARKFRTTTAFFRSSGFQHLATWISFASILLEPVRFWYLLSNLFYDLPWIGPRLLLPQLKRIIPTMRAGELSRAKGYGGMRLQRVDTRTRELLLGEGKILGDNIIFNMSPSPGASVCLYNATRDAREIVKFLKHYSLDSARVGRELGDTD